MPTRVLVQVKSNAKAASFWLVGIGTVVSETHFYVLVNLQSKEGAESPEYFVLPSKVLAEKTVHSKRPKADMYSVNRKDILEYKGKWDVLGDPHG